MNIISPSAFPSAAINRMGITAPTSSTRVFSDPAVEEQNWADLERLTPSDRALLKAASGYDVPTRASGQPPIAPILAFQISGDRKSGVIPMGQPISARYLTDLIGTYAKAGVENPFGDQLDKALKYLIENPPTSQIDIDA